ncbi:MAG TPA: sterol desaturase family protein [Vicinamibacteria bacterium]|nr:sterol desaturase family protein [Vicinamibacteria bacterium]
MSHEKLVVLAMMAANGLALFLLERRGPSGGGDGRSRHVGPNLALTALLIAANVALERISSAVPVATGEAGAGLARWAPPGWAAILLVVIALDGLAYLAHVLMHKLPPAWRFHRVHHSDAYVDVTTAFRQHPFETAWRQGFLLAGALALGASPAAVAVYLALSALNAQVEHADVRLPWRLERALRLLVATPAMHRVHHSRRQAETDTNYSNIFSFWDRLFGTFRAPRRGERIATGLDEYDGPRHQRTAGLLALPFAR